MKKFVKKTVKRKKLKDGKSESKDPSMTDSDDLLSPNCERGKVGKSKLPGTSADAFRKTSTSGTVFAPKRETIKAPLETNPFLVPSDSSTTIDPRARSSEDGQSRCDAKNGYDRFCQWDPLALYRERRKDKSDSSASDCGSVWDLDWVEDDDDPDPFLGKGDDSGLPILMDRIKSLQDQFNCALSEIGNQLSQLDELFQEVTTAEESAANQNQSSSSVHSYSYQSESESESGSKAISKIDETPVKAFRLQVGSKDMGSNCMDLNLVAGGAKSQSGPESTGACPPNSISGMSAWGDEDDAGSDGLLRENGNGGGLLVDEKMRVCTSYMIPVSQLSQSDE